MIMNYYRHLDRSKVQFDFVVHTSSESAYDKSYNALTEELKEIDIRIVEMEQEKSVAAYWFARSIRNGESFMFTSLLLRE